MFSDQVGFVIGEKVAATAEEVLGCEWEGDQQEYDQQSAEMFHVRLASSSFSSS